MHQVEPFYGWEKHYQSSYDKYSPFYGEAYSEVYYDRQVYQYLAHPQWDEIGSESLLLKILFVDYDRSCAVIELFGVWNDLLTNDFRLLLDACLEPLLGNGVHKFILIMENVLNIYLDADDYYESFQEENDQGWICMLRAREHVLQEMKDNDITPYFFWSDQLDALPWRKMKPLELLSKVEEKMNMFLP